jgi:hypothetical protein
MALVPVLSRCQHGQGLCDELQIRVTKARSSLPEMLLVIPAKAGIHLLILELGVALGNGFPPSRE